MRTFKGLKPVFRAEFPYFSGVCPVFRCFSGVTR